MKKVLNEKYKKSRSLDRARKEPSMKLKIWMRSAKSKFNFYLWFFKNKIYLFFNNRKALKMFTPISVDASDSDELKSILNEIEVLRKVVHKNVSMSSTTWTRFQLNVGNHIFYSIVTGIYEVNINYYIIKLLLYYSASLL